MFWRVGDVWRSIVGGAPPKNVRPEKIAYAVADHIGGPYTPMGIISEIAGNSNTTHPAIVNFKGQWLFFSQGSQGRF